MSGYTIDEARRIAINCASSYKSSLEDKQFIIIYRDKVYSKIRHVAKGLNLGTIKFPTEVSDKISLENYMPKKC